ncbi:hypothetical protein [Rhodococcus sp. MEB041]|uniref:hypothetical protein n=1 Tax=Rhodococcus sp. MEB041 TaxID=3040323 RepID=UPI00254F5541|nr:hypothetical protein [Rhodococcus sp. MEB041]
MSTDTEAQAYSRFLDILGAARFDYPRNGNLLGHYAQAFVNAGARPPARVIEIGLESVTAALDALPVGSIITCDEQDEDLVYVKRASGMGFDVWREDGRSNPVTSEHIARHQVPITVIREGNGA